MEESQGSDSDFWQALESSPILLNSLDLRNSLKKSTLRHNIERIKTIIPSEEYKNEFKLGQNMQESWEREKIENTIERIKQANYEYLKNIKITVRNQTKKELRAAVLDIQSQFQLEVITIKQDHDKMKEEISNKNREIYGYGQYNIDQNSLIFNHQMKEPGYIKVKSNKIDKEIAKVKDLIGVFKLQLDAVKEITAEYNKEAQAALMKVKEVDNEIQKINSAHQMSIQVLKQTIGSQEEEVLLEKQKIQEEFDSFQDKISHEIEIRKLLDKRQDEFIFKLKNEIKDAKIILQNPRMRIRVHEKLKEAAEEKGAGLPKILSGKEKGDGKLNTGRGIVSGEFANARDGKNSMSRTTRNKAGHSFLF